MIPSTEAQNIEDYDRLAKGLNKITVYDSICSDTLQDKRLKILSCHPNISIDPQKGSLEGYSRITLEKTIDGKGRICFKLEKGLDIKKVLVNGVSVNWLALSEDIYAAEIPDENELALEVNYRGAVFLFPIAIIW